MRVVASAAAAVGNVCQELPSSQYSATKSVSSDDSSTQVRVTLVALATVATRPLGAAGGMVTVAGPLGEERPFSGCSARTRISWVALGVRLPTSAEVAPAGAVR